MTDLDNNQGTGEFPEKENKPWWKRAKPRKPDDSKGEPVIVSESVPVIESVETEIKQNNMCDVEEIAIDYPILSLEWFANELGLNVQNKALPRSFFTLDGSKPTTEMEIALDTITQSLPDVYKGLGDNPWEAATKKVDTIANKNKVAIDMRIFSGISKDRMLAWGLIFPPFMDGALLDEKTILTQLKVQGIVYGIDLPSIFDVIKKGQWLKLFVVAIGKNVVNGENGRVIDRFSRHIPTKLSVSDDEIVDFKDLNWLQKIGESEVICDIILPTVSENGRSVSGADILAQVGKEAKIPAGNNTKLSEDMTALIAECTGQLSFAKGLFQVDQTVDISGNVDNSVGNIKVDGDVIIKGNVMEGFSVTATGNIVVKGLVEGAFLKAGANIQVALGMKGNSKGTLEAEGDVMCKYLENCTVKAGGNVTADSIINSKVYSGGQVSAISGHGVIISGKIIALKKIEAKTIGNSSHRITEVSLGIDPKQLEEAKNTEKEIEVLNKSINENRKNIAYLETIPKLDETYQQLLSQLKDKVAEDKVILDEKTKLLAELALHRVDADCTIAANIIYPSVILEISGSKMTVQTILKMSKVRKHEGEISVFQD